MKDVVIPEYLFDKLLDDTSISDCAKVTYLKIYGLADKQGCCEARNKQIDGKGTGRNASRHIKELINAGYLESKIESNYIRKLFICRK